MSLLKEIKSEAEETFLFESNLQTISESQQGKLLLEAMSQVVGQLRAALNKGDTRMLQDKGLLVHGALALARNPQLVQKIPNSQGDLASVLNFAGTPNGKKIDQALEQIGMNQSDEKLNAAMQAAEQGDANVLSAMLDKLQRAFQKREAAAGAQQHAEKPNFAQQVMRGNQATP